MNQVHALQEIEQTATQQRPVTLTRRELVIASLRANGFTVSETASIAGAGYHVARKLYRAVVIKYAIAGVAIHSAAQMQVALHEHPPLVRRPGGQPTQVVPFRPDTWNIAL